MRILIVKLSSLGDVVHAMPAVQDILQAYPLARIDWVVERSFAPLVRRCVGVNQVIECELRRWRKAPLSRGTRRDWGAFKRELQQVRYDAVIDLQGLSKSALISWLALLTPQGLRYGMANQTEGSGFEAPARWVADVALTMPSHMTAVARSRLLCAQALGYEVSKPPVFNLQALVNSEHAAIKKIPNHKGIVALVHGTSRADKRWPIAFWQALAQRLNDNGYAVALPHGSDEEQQHALEIALPLAYSTVWPRLGLDDLTDALAQCAGVIGVDSGLSHMAVALDLPHVQIYNFDTVWRTGPSAAVHQCSVFATPTPSVEVVWQAWQALAVPRQVA